jgi:hypothetical protein
MRAFTAMQELLFQMQMPTSRGSQNYEDILPTLSILADSKVVFLLCEQFLVAYTHTLQQATTPWCYFTVFSFGI